MTTPHPSTHRCVQRIKEASISDIPVIRTLADITFRDTYKDILSAEQMEYMMEWMYSEASLRKQISVDGHQYFIVYSDEQPIGYASVSKDKENSDGLDVFHLQKIYLLPANQRSGVGRDLFEKVLSYVKECHPEECWIELNVNRNNPAFGFYRKMGLEILRQGDFPIGNGFYMNDYIMGKKI